jgi:hypothetical protein
MRLTNRTTKEALQTRVRVIRMATQAVTGSREVIRRSMSLRLVYIPWCHAEACRQPVRKVRTGNSTLACYWEAYSDEGDDGYYFQLFDRFRPDETVYSWEFLISNGESLGVTEEMQEAVEDLILLGEDSESGEGSESVDSILTVSPVPSVGE